MQVNSRVQYTLNSSECPVALHGTLILHEEHDLVHAWQSNILQVACLGLSNQYWHINMHAQ